MIVLSNGVMAILIFFFESTVFIFLSKLTHKNQVITKWKSILIKNRKARISGRFQNKEPVGTLSPMAPRCHCPQGGVSEKW